jgi:hypothetical protein
MSLSQMQVFNDYVMPGTMELVAQEVDKFNAASRGAITLSTDGFTGDFARESFFQTLASAQRRVDRYAAQASAAATDLTETQHSMVKVAGGFGPIRYEPSQMAWLQRPTQEGIAAASEAFAKILMQDQLNSAIASAVAAISNQATATNDVSGGSPISYAAINGAHAKFGDSSSLIVADVMSGACYHKLIGDNLANTERLFQYGSVLVVDVLGKAVIVTDAPALTNAAVDYKVLGLVQGGVTVNNTSDVISNIETTNGQTRIETTMQVDYTFGLGLKGYTWDETNGGKSPTDAELATGSNWDKVVTDIKHTAGVIAVGDQS